VAVALDSSRFATRADGDTRLPICLSSEAPYERWWGTEILGHERGEIDLGYCERGLAFCADHDTERQVGVLEDVTVDEDGCIRGLLRFGAHPDAIWIEADMRSGVRPYVSIGYRINAMKLTETDENQNDTYRVTNWTLFEGSSVAVPADVSVGVGRDTDLAAFPLAIERQAPRKGEEQEDHMPEARADAAPAPAAAPSNEQIRQAVEAERERCSTIRSIASELDLEGAEVQRLIDEGTEAGAAGRALVAQKRAAGAGRPATVVTVGHDRAGDAPWESKAEFFRAVVRAERGQNDPRLIRAATGASEGSMSDGGFLLAPQFMPEVIARLFQGGEIIKRVRRVPLGPNSNALVINAVDETSRATGSRWGGVQGYWAAEADTATAKKPKFRQMNIGLNKIIALLYATDELMEDSVAFANIAETSLVEELIFLAEDAIVNGLGAGQPLGIMASGALVTQTKVAAQAATTVVAGNITAMYSRMHPSSIQNAVWLIDPSVMQQLPLMTIGQQPVFLPQGGLNNSPYGLLMGRPVIPVEYNAAMGTLGDILFVDLSQYIVAEKSGGPQVASSLHVRFLNGEQVLRATWRIAGQPAWNAALTPKNGGNTISSLVALETRA
jgi:HK97 family phage major capsid protein